MEERPIKEKDVGSFAYLAALLSGQRNSTTTKMEYNITDGASDLMS